MNDDLALSLTDAELDELDLFLRRHNTDDGPLLDGVHGLLTALLIGPEPARPDEWLPEVLHETFDDAAEGNHILSLLARLSDSIPLEIEHERYEPILDEVDTDEGDSALSAAGWCHGFAQGINLRAELWELRLEQDAELMRLLNPVVVLAIESGALATDDEVEALDDAEYDSYLAQLPETVGALAEYWRVHPPTTREQAATGSASSVEFRVPPGRRGGRWLH
ncbi:YecA family protein [Metallibacterium sp.]|uniref:YecA/YgfB family protein n=1 Tax=Metallibacterium sp. TaxID=2940281 RepID=UPI0026392E74|nr:YecA family protein [Metallibacterium sp.]